MAKVTHWWAFWTAAMRAAGPMTQPTFHPVNEKLLPPLLIVSVRSASPGRVAARTCRVAYDLWDEVYRLKISGPGGERDGAALNIDGVLRQCFEARRLTVADRSLLAAGKPHFLGAIVEVDPVNAQMVEEMRKWVSRPAGSTGIGPADALFGSFVGLLMRQTSAAGRTLRFRTQSITP